MQRNDLNEHVAMVTGGGRGLGLAVAKAFAAAGARLLLVARSASELSAAVAACPPGTASAFPADVGLPGAAAAAVGETLRQWGRIDILVNAAGTHGPVGPAADLDPQEWFQAIAVNLAAPFWALQAAVPAMRRQGRGKIINFAGGGDGPMPRFGAYTASKTGLVRLTESLGEELGEFNIDLNIIAPGPVNTQLFRSGLQGGAERIGEANFQTMLAQQQSGGVPPERAAELCLFLASPASDGLRGRYLSAVWDRWRDWGPEQVAALAASADLARLRRRKPDLDPPTEQA